MRLWCDREEGRWVKFSELEAEYELSLSDGSVETTPTSARRPQDSERKLGSYKGFWVKA